MTAAHLADLARAVRLLEQPSLAAKLADFAGQSGQPRLAESARGG